MLRGPQGCSPKPALVRWGVRWFLERVRSSCPWPCVYCKIKKGRCTGWGPAGLGESGPRKTRVEK